jgi:hypothetical protein
MIQAIDQEESDGSGSNRSSHIVVLSTFMTKNDFFMFIQL